MPLIKSVLKQKLQVFANQNHSTFEGFPTNSKDNAEKWADAIDFYAGINVIPLSTTSLVARKALVDIMTEVSEPISEISSATPFTIYYKSPETRMRRFVEYLTNVVGYKSNPLLDSSQSYTRLAKIRDTYNKQRPSISLSDTDLVYNQRRFNQIFAKDILEKRRFKLLPDGVTIDPSNLPYIYRKIPVNKEGIIIELQPDGLVGDDTIRYWPIVSVVINQKEKNKEWNSIYAQLPYIAQPSEAGEVWVGKPKKLDSGDWNINNQVMTPGSFKKEFIDTKICRDYTKSIIEKTQSELDKGIFDSSNRKVIDFVQVFEKNHSTCDDMWLNNKITTLDQYITYLKSKKVEFLTLPSAKKSALSGLENGIRAYAAALAVGMNPAFTGAPSTNQLTFETVIAKGKAGGSNAECLDIMCNLIDIYFKTGTATNNSSGATSTWQ